MGVSGELDGDDGCLKLLYTIYSYPIFAFALYFHISLSLSMSLLSLDH